MESLLVGALMLTRWDVLFALLVGSVGGVVIGAIPGVGPVVAILLSATFSRDPIVGLTMLLRIYGSSMYGGAIPAVLINTPGTAVNALTSYDGYPMTERGEAAARRLIRLQCIFLGRYLRHSVPHPVVSGLGPHRVSLRQPGDFSGRSPRDNSGHSGASRANIHSGHADHVRHIPAIGWP